MIGENTMNDEVRLDDDCNRESTGNNSARENEQPADWNSNNRVNKLGLSWAKLRT